MGVDHEHPEGLIKPGNEDYLSYYIHQEEWKPTKPHGKFGAIISSPGPAIVRLPSSIGEKHHDPRKTKAPAYKIGLKDDRQSHPYSPGPARYDTRKLTNKGKDVCNAPVIGEVIEGLVPYRSPGPAVYNRGDCDRVIFPKTPAYSMRPKTETLKGFVTPAPASYTLPDTLGPGRSPYKKSPSYRMGERLDKTGIYQPNPGPAAYKLPTPNVTKPKAPSFSMRTKDPAASLAKTGISSPGPGSSDYHLVKFHKPATPRYSFGIRHTPFEAFQHFAAEN